MTAHTFLMTRVRQATGGKGSVVSFREQGVQNPRSLFFSMADFTDMGTPDTITVTVEPGDLLNV